MAVSVKSYLDMVLLIESLHPTYQLGHSGTDGKCDCIGLTIGAIRRAGGTWTGTHGSNYAARYEIENLRPVSAGLKVGDVVLKAHEPGESGYALPDKYKSGADKRDYYHIGTVYSVSPLVIIHCTGPGVIRDTTIGKWKFCGELKKVNYGLPDAPIPDDPAPEEEEPMICNSMVTKINGATGKTVNMRAKAKAGSTLLAQVPFGTVVPVDQTEGDWSHITYKGKSGWMMTKYLTCIDTEETDEPDTGEAGPEDEGESYTVDELTRIVRDLEKRLKICENEIGSKLDFG